MVSPSTIMERRDAMATYATTSFSARFFVSVTMADIPLKKLCFPARWRISSMASMVSSADVVVSKIINIMVESPELNTFRIFSGSISIGTDKSEKLSYQTTFDTCSVFSIFSFNAATSRLGIPSQINMEYAPVPNSSTRISCPIIVSI